MCSSPQPAMMCSPDSSMEHCTSGSDLERRLRPSTSLGRSLRFLGCTATRTTGETEYFMVTIGCELHVASASAMVPALRMYWSMPTSAHGVARGDGLDGLGLAAHHEDGALHVLDVEVLLLALHVVGAHDLDLLAGLDRAGEDAAEGEEAALVGRRDELRDVHHERALGVALAMPSAHLSSSGPVYRLSDTVALRRTRRRQVLHEHLEQRVVRRQPLLHAALEQRLLAQLEVLLG